MEEKNEQRLFLKQWELACLSIKHVKNKCHNCRYGSNKPDNKGKCRYYSKDCFSLETALANKELAGCGNTYISFVNFYKAILCKMRYYFVKLDILGKMIK